MGILVLDYKKMSSQRCSQNPRQVFDMESLAIILNSFQTLIITAELFFIDICGDPGYASDNFNSEVVALGCSIKKVFLEISQNSLENTCVRDALLIRLQACDCRLQVAGLAQVFSCKFCKISKNTFFYRTPPVAASTLSNEN